MSRNTSPKMIKFLSDGGEMRLTDSVMVLSLPEHSAQIRFALKNNLNKNTFKMEYNQNRKIATLKNNKKIKSFTLKNNPNKKIFKLKTNPINKIKSDGMFTTTLC